MATDLSPSPVSPESPSGPPNFVPTVQENQAVTFRCFAIGLGLSAGLAALNAYVENQLNVHFLSGIHLPIGGIFGLLFMVLAVNGPLKALTRGNKNATGPLRPFSATELLTIYVMMLFASLVSTPGCDNFFLTTGAGLSYFTTRENGWSDLFYQYLPKHFAPGWDGHTFKEDVISPMFLGDGKVPWADWMALLTAFGILLCFVYGFLFFLSLMLRRQWIESEAISFPLVQLPLQMVDAQVGSAPPSAKFWADRTMWGGLAIAFSFHFIRGMSNYFPDWPQIASFQGNDFAITFTEAPWNSMPKISLPLYCGAIGIAYLLTRELSFSFWFFYLFMNLEFVLATLSGYPAASLPADTYMKKPLFITQQSIGAWMAMGGLLLWAGRVHFKAIFTAAISGKQMEGEPFSPRFIVGGLVASTLGALGWCLFSGINPIAAVAFFTFFGITSIVLARLVVEAGFLFPQTTYGGLESLTATVMSTSAIGPASMTRLTVLQPMFFADMRNNLLPGFLNTLKIAHSLHLDTRHTRRILGAALVAVVVGVVVSTFVTVTGLYKTGGLAGYTWFSSAGPKMFWEGSTALMRKQPAPTALNWSWVLLGAGIVWALTMARARFLWFPLHPLAFIVCSGYPITRLWTSFFIGWLCKSIFLKFGGQDWANRARPFFIGLIMGNAIAMVLWMIFGFFKGTQITYWPA